MAQFNVYRFLALTNNEDYRFKEPIVIIPRLNIKLERIALNRDGKVLYYFVGDLSGIQIDYDHVKNEIQKYLFEHQTTFLNITFGYEGVEVTTTLYHKRKDGIYHGNFTCNGTIYDICVLPTQHKHYDGNPIRINCNSCVRTDPNDWETQIYCRRITRPADVCEESLHDYFNDGKIIYKYR